MPESPVSNRLDSPPPAPPGMVRRVPDTPAPAAPMMGGGEVSQNTVPQAIIERAMMAEQALTSMSEIIPSLTPLVAGLVDQLRAGVAGVLQGGGTAPQPQSAPSGMAGIMSSGGAQPAAGAA